MFVRTATSVAAIPMYVRKHVTVYFLSLPIFANEGCDINHLPWCPMISAHQES